MIIDSNNRPWIWGILAVGSGSAVGYALYAMNSPNGPSGGSWPGLLFGTVAIGLMVFAALLGARRKYPTLHVGRMQFWMRGHLWLGLLSFLMVLFHSGFRVNGTLNTVLFVLFTLVIVSGLVGTLLQQILPRLMMEQIPTEVVFDQADKFIDQLVSKAQQRVESLAPKAGKTDTEPDNRTYEHIKRFYTDELTPFLRGQKPSRLLSTELRSDAVFSQLRKITAPPAHPVIEDLRTMVRQRRDLTRQMRLHHILHNWLLIHAPLSAAVLVLTVAHVVMSLRFLSGQ